MGWGLKKVSVLLGHSDIQTTAKIYTHLLDGDLRVQDENRFDNLDSRVNSIYKEEKKNNEPVIEKAIAEIIMQMKNITNSNAEIKYNELRGHFQKLLENSNHKQTNLISKQENMHNATNMLQLKKEIKLGFGKQNKMRSESLLEISNLFGLKMVPRDGIIRGSCPSPSGLALQSFFARSCKNIFLIFL